VGQPVEGINIKHNKWSEKVDRITAIGDIRDKNFFSKLPRSDFDMIIPLAANARVYNLVKNPILARDNFKILFNILEFSRLNNVDRFIFASSREVYGNSEKFFHNEEEAYVKNSESPYTATKIGGEALVHSYHQCYGIDFVILRFSNVYGKYDDSDRVIPVFIETANQNKDLIVFGKDKLLDFTYIDDCVDGIIKSIENFGGVKNNTINIASGKGIAIVELAKVILNKMTSREKIIVKESRTGEVTKCIVDISRARELLNYEPKVSIDEGIERAIEWYKSRGL
jgi:UDP-glucose 4-epimerase